MARYAAFQSHPQWYVSQVRHSPSPPPEEQSSLPISFAPVRNLRSVSELQVLGTLEVRRLGMSVLVVEGDDEEKLGLAAGHVPGSAAIGALGNAVVAGHRDTSFWQLRKIRVGDKVRVRAGKSYNYVVSSIRVVSPDDVSVLAGSADKSSLTMVTCYPFRYFGSAPKRFIVQAIIPTS